MQIEDDFDRFCKIAKNKTAARPRVSPEDFGYNPANYYNAASSFNAQQRKRASSFREPRKHTRPSTSTSQPQLPGGPGATGSRSYDISSDRSPHKLSDGSSPGIPTIEETDVDFPRRQTLTSTNLPSSSESRVRRNRTGGSMREPTRPSRSNECRIGAKYRPSISNISPIPTVEQPSPNRRPTLIPDSNLIRVRSFHRKKSGQVISKGEKDIPTSLLYPSEQASPFGGGGPSTSSSAVEFGRRPSYKYSSPSESDKDEENANDDLIEIPAITTTMFDTHTGSSPSPRRERASSPAKLLQPALVQGRYRSRSWALQSDESIGGATEQSSTSPRPLSFRSDSSSVGSGLVGSTAVLNVKVFGAPRVGKTSTCMQFLTSKTIDDGSFELEGAESSPVAVDVDGAKFNVLFTDCDLRDDEIQNLQIDSWLTDLADAYLVIYAVDDKSSFYTARNLVNYLIGECKRSSAIIIAANKSDLVRTRVVSYEDGKKLAAVYSCPFFEISTSLNHKVDELLVGVVTAIQAKHEAIDKVRYRLERIASAPVKRRSSVAAIKSGPSNLLKFFRKHVKRSKSPTIQSEGYEL